MQVLTDRFNFFFRSTKGLVLVAIALISLVTAVWGTLSGPMEEYGVKELTVKALGMDLAEAEREGRIVMLYHAIAIAVVAIEVYLITDIVPMKDYQASTINGLITAGYMMVLVFGLGFAYFGHNWIFHGLFLAGQSIVFFAGLLLAIALWPWKKEYAQENLEYARSKKGLDLERVAFFTMAVATLGSAMFGAAAGASFGNGFETFLAEDVVREPHKTALQLAVIGHLHIMLTLIAVALTLLIGRWFDFKGILQKIAMPLMISGTIILTLGVWSVVPYEETAHIIIYVGSVLVMLAALMLVIFGFDKLIRSRLAEQGIEKGNGWQKIKALLHDPLKFGSLWQMVYMNFTVSGIGIFMAVKLDEIFRVWPAREERISLTGHWHILAGIIATIILFYYADLAGLKGKTRRWFGWLVILGSDLAFGAMTTFSMKRLITASDQAQQSLAKWAILFADVGLLTVLVVLAALMVWRLIDLFKKRGRWSQELSEGEKIR
jgi:MFS family permease